MNNQRDASITVLILILVIYAVVLLFPDKSSQYEDCYTSNEGVHGTPEMICP